MTLVEVLVALTLLGLMTVFLFGSFRLGVRAWEAGDRQVDELGEVEVAQNLLRNELSQATLLLIEGRASEPESTFMGSSNQLQFLAPLPTHRGVGGYYLFWLSSSDSPEHDDLLLRWRLYRPDLSVEQAASDDMAVLLRRVTDVNFGYYGRVRDHTEADWHDSWDGQDGLPELVRLRIEFPTEDQRRWPELVIAPRFLGAELQR